MQVGNSTELPQLPTRNWCESYDETLANEGRIRCMTWSTLNLIAVASSNGAQTPRGVTGKRKRDRNRESLMRPHISIFQSTEGGNQLVEICNLHRVPELHGGNAITCVQWDQHGKYLSSVDQTGRIIIWQLKGCINQWDAVHTVDLDEPVVAFQWLQEDRLWGVDLSSGKFAPTQMSDAQAGAGLSYFRTPFMGPKPPLSDPGFIVLSRSGKIHVFQLVSSGQVETFSVQIPGLEVLDTHMAVDGAPVHHGKAGNGVTHADIHLRKANSFTAAIYCPDALDSSVCLYDFQVNFSSLLIHCTGRRILRRDQGEHTAAMISDGALSHLRILGQSRVIFVVSNRMPDAGELLDRKGAPSDDDSRGSSVYICEWTSMSDDNPSNDSNQGWAISANYHVTGDFVSALEVMERSESGRSDGSRVILLGYSSGKCEMRDGDTLLKTDLGRFTFSPYKDSATENLSEPAIQQAAGRETAIATGLDEDPGINTNSPASCLTEGDGISEVHRASTEPAHGDYQKMSSICGNYSSSGGSTKRNGWNLPIINFAVSPNSVEILVAKDDTERGVIIDLMKHDIENIEALESHTIVEALSTKLAIALANRVEYIDLLFATRAYVDETGLKDLTIQIMRRVYAKHAEIMSLSGWTPATTFPYNAALSVENGPVGLQLAMYRMIPSHEQLYANTQVWIQLQSVLAQCYSAFEQPEAAWEVIANLLQKSDVQDLERAGKLQAAMIVRKECLQPLVAFALWLSDFCTTLLRQVYCLLNMEQKSLETAGEGRPLHRYPSVLPFLFHTGIRRTILSILFIMIYLEYNIHLRRSMWKNNAELQGFLIELALLFRRSRVKFVPFAGFLADIGKEVSEKLQEQSIDETQRLIMEQNMLVQGTVDEAYTSSLSAVRTAFETRICDIFPPDTPLVDPVLSSSPDDLLAMRLGPSITTLFKAPKSQVWPLDTITDDIWGTPFAEKYTSDRNNFILEEISGRLDVMPPAKRKKVDAIRSHIDVVTKARLSRADTVRQCIRCLQFSRGNASGPDSESEHFRGADTLMSEIGLLAKGPVVWRGAFRNCCICGGSWREVLDIS
ncbi:uncharacterized protein SPPG_08693 [Spizellomyces punctatus DAOM BR117]|uniref:Uncharacterized protein n=1 Tax=Spizellomyces punctatus (strain DAOM BR117) TaxID=645134 RepID=A0A0L0H396_SPIPD|nr:uncharacterized protein SPPG_08693 [Spizellomyces punctatus DAOM BR117]KNC95940.1 hypothetical protein SPPG_08693 [Spizellomyces punctatus DAOM BR117]|eukprot:XP_016603980.1 hypothetical protein SPPG_08693 [Spizellomyces punctatus DAOM BR117]